MAFQKRLEFSTFNRLSVNGITNDQYVIFYGFIHVFVCIVINGGFIILAYLCIQILNIFD